VRVHRPAKASQLLEESVALTIGELSAFGLEVEVLHTRRVGVSGPVSPLPPGVHGVLSLWEDEDWIRIDAWAPDGGNPATVRLNVHSSDISPTVVSIRAVEALRAKWLQHAELQDSDLPEKALEFARAKSPAEPPKPEETEQAPAPAPKEPPPPPPERRSADEPDGALRLLAHAGASAGTGGGNRTAVAGDVALFASGRWLGLGIGFRGPFTRTNVENLAGRATVGRMRFVGIVRGQFSAGESVSAYAQAGWGATRFDISSTPNAGYERAAAAQTEFTVALALGADLWLIDNLGLYAEGELDMLANEVVIHLDQSPAGSFAALSYAAGAGLSVRLP
jgi:hypothetical protein